MQPRFTPHASSLLCAGNWWVGQQAYGRVAAAGGARVGSRTPEPERRPKLDLGLDGKRALVTGGSRGIGRSIVLGLAGGRASVAACYNRESDDVARLRDELAATGDVSYLAQADVSDPASVEGFVSEASRSAPGRARHRDQQRGRGQPAMITDLELSEWRRVIDTNLTAIYLIAKAALPGDVGRRLDREHRLGGRDARDAGAHPLHLVQGWHDRLHTRVCKESAAAASA